MTTETITDEKQLDDIRKMFYQEIATFEKEQRRLDGVIKERLYLIAKTRYSGKYVQTVESNIKSIKK